MDPISTLIFNALVRRQSINLPEIGSLKVITRPPVMEKKGMVTPPLNLVIYAETENPDFLNIVALIAQNNNQDEIQARAIYDSWLATVRSEEVVRIDSVGEIREKRFYPAPGLNEIMNPIRPEPARVPRQMEVRQIIWWVLGAIIIGGAISYGAITLLNRSTYSYEDEAIEWEELTPATPRTQTATDQPAATTDEAADDSEEATASAPNRRLSLHLQQQPQKTRLFRPRPPHRPWHLGRWAIMWWLEPIALMPMQTNLLHRPNKLIIRFPTINCRSIMGKL